VRLGNASHDVEAANGTRPDRTASSSTVRFYVDLALRKTELARLLEFLLDGPIVRDDAGDIVPAFL
jgi:hypothetical protein